MNPTAKKIEEENFYKNRAINAQAMAMSQEYATANGVNIDVAGLLARGVIAGLDIF